MYESLVNQPAARWFFQSEVTTYLLYCEFCELFENNIFTAQLRTAASVFIPVKICWSSTRLQRNNFTSFKTSWRRLEGILQDVLKTSWKTKNCYAEDVFKTFWRHVLKTSWKHVLKTSWRHILKTSSRRLEGKQNVYWWYLYLRNLNVYLTNLCFTNLYLTNAKCVT